MVAMKTVLAWLSTPLMTTVVLDDRCTAVQTTSHSGRSPILSLTQELVSGKKAWTSGSAGRAIPVLAANMQTTNAAVEVLPLYPPTVTRCPLRLTGADPIGEVAGRLRCGYRVGEVVF